MRLMRELTYPRSFWLTSPKFAAAGVPGRPLGQMHSF